MAALDETDGVVLRALAAPGPAYRTLPDLREATGLRLSTLAQRVPRLERAVHAVVRGEVYLGAAAAQRGADYEARYGGRAAGPGGGTAAALTPRETEVPRLIAGGRTLPEIAQTLASRPKTVESHRYRLTAELNLHRVAGLVRYAARTGLVPPEERRAVRHPAVPPRPAAPREHRRRRPPVRHRRTPRRRGGLRTSPDGAPGADP